MQINKPQISVGYDVFPIPPHTHCDRRLARCPSSGQLLRIKAPYKEPPRIVDLAASNRTVDITLSEARMAHFKGFLHCNCT